MILSAELAANATRHSKRSSHLFWLVCRRLNWFGQSSRQRAADIVQAEVPCNSDDDDDGECWNWGPTLAVVLGAASVARYGLTFRWSVCESEPGRSSSSSSCVLLLLNVDWVFAALPFCRSSPCNSIHKQNFFIALSSWHTVGECAAKALPIGMWVYAPTVWYSQAIIVELTMAQLVLLTAASWWNLLIAPTELSSWAAWQLVGSSAMQQLGSGCWYANYAGDESPPSVSCWKF